MQQHKPCTTTIHAEAQIIQLPQTLLLPAPLPQTPPLAALCAKTRYPLRVPQHGTTDRITAVNVSHFCTTEYSGPNVSRHSLQYGAALHVSMHEIYISYCKSRNSSVKYKRRSKNNNKYSAWATFCAIEHHRQVFIKEFRNTLCFCTPHCSEIM